MTQVNPGQSTIGGGSLPGETLSTYLLALPDLPADPMMARLRNGQPAVVARIVEAYEKDAESREKGRHGIE